MRAFAHLLALSLVSAPLLAGCMKPEEEQPLTENEGSQLPANDEVVATGSDATTQDEADQENDAPDGQEHETPPPAAASPNATAPPQNGTAPPPPAVAPHTREVTGEGHVGLKAGLPCQAPAPCPPVEHEHSPAVLAVPEPGPSGGSLVITWEAATEAAATLAFNATTPDGTLLGAGSGQSPLSISLDAALLKDAAEVIVAVVPPAPGLVAQQDYVVVLTLQYG